MTAEPRYEPPAHQTASFDQTFAELNARIDWLIASYVDVRTQNAATREVDIAGLAEWMKATEVTRDELTELLAVAVVRLAES